MNKGVVCHLREDSADGVIREQAEWALGQDVSIDPAKIQDFCAKPLNEIEQDLLLLTAVVAFADRRFLWRRGTGWTRRLQVRIPVSYPDLWRRSRIDGALRSALRYATGDQWDFEYVSGFEPIASGQSSLDFSNQIDVVLPFSKGLDSYLTWHILAARGAGSKCLRVHSESASSNSRGTSKLSHCCFDSGAYLTVPISLSVGTHPEPSYRTRNFMFYVVAALAAAKLELSEVVVGENGVSSIGPTLLPIGDEHPNRGTLPGYTQGVAGLINQLLGTNIQFKHPHLFRTNGQMLELVSPVLGEGWRDTNSCVRDSRSKLGVPHCGLCGGCLLRRTILHSMGWQDSEYTWTTLDRGTLGDCTPNRLERTSTPNDEDIAMHAIHSMESFAQLARRACSDDLRLRSVALELASAGVQDFESCLRSIADLCRKHCDEWNGFKEQFPPTSLLRRYELYPCVT